MGQKDREWYLPLRPGPLQKIANASHEGRMLTQWDPAIFMYGHPSGLQKEISNDVAGHE
jgi:hypothetical protein